jgi:hypothetical protein
MTQTNETVIETHLLANGYVTVKRDGFDRERAIFSETVLAFIRATQAKEWINRDVQRTATERIIVLLKAASYHDYSRCGDRQKYHI